MVPDVDVIGFLFGVRYGDMFGHRGFTHSIVFALVFSGIATAAYPGKGRETGWRTLWLYLFIATISHAVLDAFTNGGLGVAFFSPFSNHRYFFPWTPIQVSPIGVGFFSPQGLGVIKSEAVWIWLPSLAFVLVILVASKLFARKLPRN